MVTTANILFICDLKYTQSGEKGLGCRRVFAKTEVSDEEIVQRLRIIILKTFRLSEKRLKWVCLGMKANST